MPSEPLRIFDPRRNLHVQGFSGRAATTTLHDATATGVFISGIFQAAEDVAVLCLFNAYDYFNHIRLKHLPRMDLSGLKLGGTVAARRSPGIASRAFVACVPCGGSGGQRGDSIQSDAGGRRRAWRGQGLRAGRFHSIRTPACGVRRPY